MRQAGAVTFRALRHADLNLLYHWFKQPHVAKWWPTGSRDEIVEKYGRRVDLLDAVRAYVILYENRLIGYVQTETLDARTQGLDLFIGDASFLYRGLGPKIIRAFLDEIVFVDEEVETCVVDPAPDNEVAIAAFRKAGFYGVETIIDKDTGEPRYLMRAARDAGS